MFLDEASFLFISANERPAQSKTETKHPFPDEEYDSIPFKNPRFSREHNAPTRDGRDTLPEATATWVGFILLRL
jgi:hypothetical protein